MVCYLSKNFTNLDNLFLSDDAATCPAQTGEKFLEFDQTDEYLCLKPTAAV